MKHITHCIIDNKYLILNYYAQFSLQMLEFNCYVFQKIAIYNDD